MELANAQEEFLARHEGDYTTHTYDAVVLLALAYLSAGSSEPDALAKALVEVSGPPGRVYQLRKLRHANSKIKTPILTTKDFPGVLILMIKEI